MSGGARVTGLRSVEIGVADVKAAEAFFTEVWGLETVAADGETRYLKATGPQHHVLALSPAPETALLRIVFSGADRAAVEALQARIAAAGLPVEDPAVLDRPGGGYGFGFADGEGRNFAVVCEVADREDRGSEPERPHRLSHVVLNAADAEASAGLFTDALGFRLIDQTVAFKFLNCNADHHSLAFAFSEAPTVNHVAFDMANLESVMRGAGRLRDHGYGIEWGVGRHGPGNNVFAYFVGPGGLPVEYTAEVEQVDDDYRPGGPEAWRWPPGRVDHWGVSDPPSARLKEAQSRIRFVAGAFRLHGQT